MEVVAIFVFWMGVGLAASREKRNARPVQAVSTNLDTPSVTASIIWTIQNPQENPANSPNYGIDPSMTGILTDEMLFDGQLGFWSGRTGIREIHRTEVTEGDADPRERRLSRPSSFQGN